MGCMEDSIETYILYHLEMEPTILSPIILCSDIRVQGFLIDWCWLKGTEACF